MDRVHKCTRCGEFFTRVGISRHTKYCGNYTTEELVEELETNEWATLSSLGEMHNTTTLRIKKFLEGTPWEGEQLRQRGKDVKNKKMLETAESRQEQKAGKKQRLYEEGKKGCPICEILITLDEEICVFCIDDGRVPVAC